jgi:hypothetical protein
MSLGRVCGASRLTAQAIAIPCVLHAIAHAGVARDTHLSYVTCDAVLTFTSSSTGLNLLHSRCIQLAAASLEPHMSKNGSRVRPQSTQYPFYDGDRRSERWRKWAQGHNQSNEYDGNSTLIRRSWFGRLLGILPKK